jgi:hypothetical protein
LQYPLLYYHYQFVELYNIRWREFRNLKFSSPKWAKVWKGDFLSSLERCFRRRTGFQCEMSGLYS